MQVKKKTIATKNNLILITWLYRVTYVNKWVNPYAAFSAK
jgi:hypothetical protein